MVESIGTLLFYLIMVAGIGVLFASLFAGSNLSKTEQQLSTLRMQVKQLYTSAPDYSGLTSEIAIKAGVVPANMIKSNGEIRNVWNGLVTVAAGTDPNTFTITIQGVPKEDCAKLGSYQSSSWISIQLNGSEIEQNNGMVAALTTQATDTNTIIFTSN